jgi:hypothetical protein
VVRPIEITDSLSKVQAVERLQQDAKLQPEVLHQVQRTLAEKQTERNVTTPNPVTTSDQVVIHVDEREKDKRKTAEDDAQKSQDSQEHEPEDGGYDEHGAANKKDDNQQDSHSHIDIKM